MRILVACGNGSGTSLMLKRTVEKAAKNLGIKVANVHQTAISEAKNTAKNFDVVFTPANFVKDFDRAVKAHGVKVIGVKNVMSAPEIEKAFKDNELV